MSVLTFNLSVVDKENLANVKYPFQIMPATTNYLRDSTIDAYVRSENKGIILHLNYITRIFGDTSIENGSKVRGSLRQYCKLAEKLGTKNILVHGPYTVKEYNNLAYGMSIIYEELIQKGMVVHVEMPAWSKDLMNMMNPEIKEGKSVKRTKDPKEYMISYYDDILKYLEKYPKGSSKMVPDTAHMFANGCGTKEDFEFFLQKYEPWIEYIHMNGNCNYMYKTDVHCPIFKHENKMSCWKDVAELCSKMNKICIVEDTKRGASWNEWQEFANEFGFKLVEFNDALAL